MDIVTSFKASYVAGETAKLKVAAGTAASVYAVIGKDTVNLTNDGSGIWSAAVATTAMVGTVRWSVMAKDDDGAVECIGRGQFVVCCAGRSPLRDVIDKIDEAIKTWGTNPNRSISIGEIRIDYKTLDDLLAVRAQYVQMAEAQESGRSLTGGLRVMEVKFQ